MEKRYEVEVTEIGMVFCVIGIGTVTETFRAMGGGDARPAEGNVVEWESGWGQHGGPGWALAGMGGLGITSVRFCAGSHPALLSCKVSCSRARG